MTDPLTIEPISEQSVVHLEARDGTNEVRALAGRRVRSARKNLKGLTQAQLAERSGFSRQRVNEIENGVAKVVGIDDLERLANALEVTTPSLLFPESKTNWFVASPLAATLISETNGKSRSDCEHLTARNLQTLDFIFRECERAAKERNGPQLSWLVQKSLATVFTSTADDTLWLEHLRYKYATLFTKVTGRMTQESSALHDFYLELEKRHGPS